MKQLELAWTRYKSSTTVSDQLILILGTQGNKTYGLLAEKVPDNEITTIKQNKALLDNFDLSMRLAWLKSHAPRSYAQSLRTYQTNNLQLLRIHPVVKP